MFKLIKVLLDRNTKDKYLRNQSLQHIGKVNEDWYIPFIFGKEKDIDFT